MPAGDDLDGVWKALADPTRRAILDLLRQRVNSLNVVPIRQIYERWVGRFEELWTSHLLRIKEDAEEQAAKRREPRG
jgi:DNA-binding transcriptional ArsR family regulator